MGLLARITTLDIANKSVKQLTFKDLGFEIGKLDASWKSLADSDYSVVQVLNKTFIGKATNAINNEVIYLEIAKNGKVLDVHFFIELEGCQKDANVAAALKEINQTNKVKVLSSYTKAIM